MKIAINGRGLIKKHTGFANVTRNLLKEMALFFEEFEFLLFISDKVRDDYTSFFPKNVKIIKLKETSFFGDSIGKVIFEQITLVRAMKKSKVDVALFPYPSNSFFKLPFLTAVIVHDAIPWKYKEYQKGFLSKLNFLFLKRNIKKADIVFTVSKHSKRDLIKYCGIDEDLIKVVYNDASNVFKEKEDKSHSEKLLKKLGLNRKKFLIYAGGYDERKNVKKIVLAFNKFSKKDKNFKLLLVGEKIFDDSLYSSFDELKNSKNIVFSGNISDKDLHCLYNSAFCFIHLSKDEGFNLPIIEASNASLPLILSDIDVHKEIAGKDATFVDSEDSDLVFEKINDLLDEEFYEKSRNVSKKIAGKYLWERSALRYIDIILKKLND